MKRTNRTRAFSRSRRSADYRSRRSSRKPARERSVDLERYRSIISDWPDFLASVTRIEPTFFRIRTGRVSEELVLERLGAKGFQIRPLPGMPAFHRIENAPVPISMTAEHWLGWIYVQQASTGVAAPALGPQPRERVLDLCSAPGGKTTHMADLMKDSGCIVASEISESRIRGLLGNVYRLAHPNILVVAADGREFPEGPQFDRVLVDAPCSGEGTLRRRGGRVPNQSRSFLAHVTRLQRLLLEKAVRVTRPGGIILYATCTFSPEENEAVVSDALERLPIELEPLSLSVTHAAGLSSFEGLRFDPRLEGAARIYPQHLDSGGLFLAKLRKLDDGRVADGNGWSVVPTVFPHGDPSSFDAELRLRNGVAELTERFGLKRALEDVRWVSRGGRVWLHTMDEWPLRGWAEGSWRLMSVGFRAIDFDTRGRPRPTNDLLRWSAEEVTQRVADLAPQELELLLQREAVPTSVGERGPIAFRYEGDVIGRGAVTADGLKSEIPKARAADLSRILVD